MVYSWSVMQVKIEGVEDTWLDNLTVIFANENRGRSRRTVKTKIGGV